MSRPCSVCRKRFEPDPRAAKHAKTCSPACRQELHRRRCLSWHARHPDYDREQRLRGRVVPAREGAPPAAPLDEVDWSAARDAVGLEVQVVVEEVVKVLARGARDAVRSKEKGKAIKPHQVPLSRGRDAVGRSGPAP